MTLSTRTQLDMKCFKDPQTIHRQIHCLITMIHIMIKLNLKMHLAPVTRRIKKKKNYHACDVMTSDSGNFKYLRTISREFGSGPVRESPKHQKKHSN